MLAVPILMVTHDDALWQHWRSIESDAWLPARGSQLQDLSRWAGRGHHYVLLDAGLPQLPAWEDRVWQQLCTDLKIIVGSMRPDDNEGKRVLSAGAAGYIHSYMPASALRTVLHTVAAGNVWVGPTLLARLLRQVDQSAQRTDDWAEGLTQREREVAERAAVGHANQAIADALGISERTVRAHLTAIFAKLDVEDRLQLALRVHGIVA